MSHIEEGRLHAYLDGECAEREIEQIEAHLAICDECQERLEAATAASRTASDLLAEVEPGPVSAPTWRELEARAAARTRSAPRRTWVRPSLAWAAMIAVASGSVGSRTPTGPTPDTHRLQASDPRLPSCCRCARRAHLPQAPAQPKPASSGRPNGTCNEQYLRPPAEGRFRRADPTRPWSRSRGGSRDSRQEEALAARRRSQQTEISLGGNRHAARPPAEPSPAVAGVEATRELAERRERQDLPPTGRGPKPRPRLRGSKSVLRPRPTRRRPVFSRSTGGCAAWLNGDLRTLPDLQLSG